MDLDLNLLLVQLVIIFLPGVIWERLDARFAAKVKPSSWEIFVRALLFGFVVYAVEFLIYSAFNQHFTPADFANAGAKNVVTMAVAREILWALPISLCLSVLWLYTARYKWLSRFLQSIGATKKFGDEDVWDYTFNSSIPDVEYVHVRDFENGYLYAGWVNTFSESGRLRELVLLDVIVYDLEGKEQYKTPRLYIARAPENTHIEFPYEQPKPPTPPTSP
jgi:hypothetical protein